MRDHTDHKYTSVTTIQFWYHSPHESRETKISVELKEFTTTCMKMGTKTWNLDRSKKFWNVANCCDKSGRKKPFKLSPQDGKKIQKPFKMTDSDIIFHTLSLTRVLLKFHGNGPCYYKIINYKLKHNVTTSLDEMYLHIPSAECQTLRRTSGSAGTT